MTGRVYVWVWLPGHSQPVVAGVLRRQNLDPEGTYYVPRDNGLWFRYAPSYLSRPDAISLYGPELPLEDRWFPPAATWGMPSVIRDSFPDAWGVRVAYRMANPTSRGFMVNVSEYSDEYYMLTSGTNRIGAVDFQASPHDYEPRIDHDTTLDKLHQASLNIDDGESLSPELLDAISHGTSIGGARPKAVVTGPDGAQWVAKFSWSADQYNVIGAEAAALHLAAAVGIDVPEPKVVTSLGRDVLLTRRFDRTPDGGRRLVVSGKTMLRAGAQDRGSYPALLDVLRLHGTTHAVKNIGPRLFQRILFNALISNTDDHLRNHSAFWDGVGVVLTPAYDLTPCVQLGPWAQLSTPYSRDGKGRVARLARILKSSHEYGLSEGQGKEMAEKMVETIREQWPAAADFGRLTNDQQELLTRRAILRPDVFED